MNEQGQIEKLVMSSLRRRLYVAFSLPLVPVPELGSSLLEHLEYMVQHEDKVFLSGPFLVDGASAGEGLTVILAEDEAVAREFMDNEPWIRKGLRRYDLKLWELREGTLTLSTRLSRTTFSLNDRAGEA